MLLNNALALKAMMSFCEDRDKLIGAHCDIKSAEIVSRKLESCWRRAITSEAYSGYSSMESPALDRLPLTHKAALRDNPSSYDSAMAVEAIRYYETSGTTGKPIPVPRTIEDIVWNLSSVAEAWRRIIQPNGRAISLMPSDFSPIGDLVAGACDYLGVCHLRAYPFSVGISSWDRILAVFQNLRPKYVFGAPGVIIQLMRIAKQRDCFSDISSSVEHIMLLGEVASQPLRQAMASWWDACIHDASFGSTETGTIAAADGSGNLSVLQQNFILEVETDGVLRPLRAGEAGQLVVTTLNSFARPLLRYATGDLVSVTDSVEKGGLLLQIRGRASDGVRVGAEDISIDAVENIVYEVDGVTGYLVQVHQATNRVKLILERDIGMDEDEVDIQHIIQRSKQVGITWAGVQSVSQLSIRTKSGAGQKNWKRTHVETI